MFGIKKRKEQLLELNKRLHMLECRETRTLMLLNKLWGYDSFDCVPFTELANALYYGFEKMDKRVTEFIKNTEERLKKQEQAIETVFDLCKPLVADKINFHLKDLSNGIEEALQELILLDKKTTSKNLKKCEPKNKTNKKRGTKND